MKLKKETLRLPYSQDKITSRCVHVLGFVYGKQEEMPARIVVPGSCHRARGTSSLSMNTVCVLQEDSSENDEVFKSTSFFPRGKIFIQLQTSTLFHKLSLFFLTIHYVRFTNNSGLSLRSTDWKSIKGLTKHCHRFLLKQDQFQNITNSTASRYHKIIISIIFGDKLNIN